MVTVSQNLDFCATDMGKITALLSRPSELIQQILKGLKTLKSLSKFWKQFYVHLVYKLFKAREIFFLFCDYANWLFYFHGLQYLACHLCSWVLIVVTDAKRKSAHVKLLSVSWYLV
jgi:hypothetical protein